MGVQMKRQNKKGVIDQLMMVLIMAVVLVVIILVFWAGSMLLPVLTGTGNILVDTFTDSVNTNSPDTELANASNVAGNIASSILGVGESIVYIALIVLFAGFLMMAFYVRTYPFLAFFWIFIIIALTFVSMFVSNAYMTASVSSPLSSFYADWGSNDFLMSNLPSIVVFIGVIGGIFLFVLASREPESEVQQL